MMVSPRKVGWPCGWRPFSWQSFSCWVAQSRHRLHCLRHCPGLSGAWCVSGPVALLSVWRMPCDVSSLPSSSFPWALGDSLPFLPPRHRFGRRTFLSFSCPFPLLPSSSSFREHLAAVDRALSCLPCSSAVPLHHDKSPVHNNNHHQLNEHHTSLTTYTQHTSHHILCKRREFRGPSGCRSSDHRSSNTGMLRDRYILCLPRARMH